MNHVHKNLIDPELTWASIRRSGQGLEVIAGGLVSAGSQFQLRQVIDFQALIASADGACVTLDIRLPVAGNAEFQGTVDELLECLKSGPRLFNALTNRRFRLLSR